MVIAERRSPAAEKFDAELASVRAWIDGDRFADTVRLYGVRDIVEQRGDIETDFTVARVAADRLYARLRELFERHESITTFGPYSPGRRSP